MRSAAMTAFRDEMVKLGRRKGGGGWLRKTLHAGWEGVGPEDSMTRNRWFGQGLASKAERANMGGFGRALDTATSLGGLTKVLPVGAKSMMAVGTALQARDAFQQEDPTGQGRSRAERGTGLAGGTAGGLLGTGMLMRSGFGRKHPIIGSMVGGIGGTIAGEKLTTLPFKKRRPLPPPPAPVQEVPQQVQPEAVAPQPMPMQVAQ